MRTVTVDRKVSAPPQAVFHHLDPMVIIDAEGTFRALDFEEAEDGESIVVARGGGMEVAFRFTETEDGYEYAQEGEAGPFETMETELSVAAEDEGSRITIESRVSLGLPVAAVSDRIAAWKRRGELRRALKAIEAAL